jgi:hypothetical protein
MHMMDVLFVLYLWRCCGHFVVRLYCMVFGDNAMIACMFLYVYSVTNNIRLERIMSRHQEAL